MTGWAMSPEDRDQPAGRILALVLEGLLDDFRHEEALVRRSDDIEDMHQYRVVLRRTRSLLAVGGRVLPAEELELLTAMAAHLATLTSPIRDLDVLLERLDGRVADVSERLRCGIEPLRGQLMSERAERRRDLLEALDGEFSNVFARRWQVMASVYRVGGSESGPDVLHPAGEVVDSMVLDSFERLRRQGTRARKRNTDVQWHRLRKRLKRLRYLLLAFEDMYPGDSFKLVLRELADLQQGLGDLQDHVAEGDRLVAVGRAAGGDAALLAGALVDRLEDSVPDARLRCRHAWDRFDRPKVRKLVRKAVSG